MKKILPKPEEVNIQTPAGLIKEKFDAGFEHGLQYNTINISQMKPSFSMGFRAAKLYLKQVRKEQGIIELNNPQKIKFKSNDRR